MNNFEAIFFKIRNNFDTKISFNEFKNLVIKFSKNIISSFLKNNYNCKCIIKKIEIKQKGY